MISGSYYLYRTDYQQCLQARLLTWEVIKGDINSGEMEQVSLENSTDISSNSNNNNITNNNTNNNNSNNNNNNKSNNNNNIKMQSALPERGFEIKCIWKKERRLHFDASDCVATEWRMP